MFKRLLGTSLVLSLATLVPVRANAVTSHSLTCSIPSIINGSCNNGSPLVVGDKIVDQFDFSGMSVNLGDTFTISQVSDFAYQFQYNFLPVELSNSSGMFSYRVRITPEGQANGYSFLFAQANITGSVAQPGGHFSTTVTASSLTTPNPLYAASGNSSNPSKDGYFEKDVVESIFYQSFEAKGGNRRAVINSMGLLLVQTPPEPVPGPLGVVALPAMYGFSRKIRRLIGK